MQFFRKWYNVNDLRIENSDNLITNDLSTWGFVELDGSPLKNTYNHEWLNPNMLKARWRYDNNTSNFWSFIMPPGTVGNGRVLYYTNNSSVKGCGYTPGSGIYTNYIFIPLKNRGFLISSNNNSDVCPSNKPPTLLPFWYHVRSGSSASNVGGFMFYNNINNCFNLFYFGADTNPSYVYHSNITGVNLKENWDWDAGLYSTNINAGWAQEQRKNELQYDYKSNICSLIKYPCLNGFLSNLFLITTSPLPPINETDIYQSGLWGKFFSFGGRNFYCPAFNLAIELPSN